MDIRVLGPVELLAGGKPVDLGPRRQRFVFGVLALDVNQLVPIDRLVELAWPADAPRTAVHAIRVMVSRLRGVLQAAETGGVEIVTRGTSYLLAAGGLDALGTSDRSSDVRSALSWSYRGLDEPAAELFRLLGRHAGPEIGVGAAASPAGRPERAVRAVLEQLTGDHLLAESAPGPFAMHDLLRALAAELPEPAGSGDARRRLVDHYAHGAYAAVMALDPLRRSIAVSAPAPGVVVTAFADRVRALAWFDAERPALLAALGAPVSLS